MFLKNFKKQFHKQEKGKQVVQVARKYYILRTKQIQQVWQLQSSLTNYLQLNTRRQCMINVIFFFNVKNTSTDIQLHMAQSSNLFSFASSTSPSQQVSEIISSAFSSLSPGTRLPFCKSTEKTSTALTFLIYKKKLVTPVKKVSSSLWHVIDYILLPVSQFI